VPEAHQHQAFGITDVAVSAFRDRHRSIYAEVRIARRGRLHPFPGRGRKLFFQLVSSRYERASVIVSSNKAFSRWGEVFGDDTVAAAMIDRLVHLAEVINLKGDSYRLKGRDLGRVPGDDDT